MDAGAFRHRSWSLPVEPDAGLRVLSVGQIANSVGCTQWRRLGVTIICYVHRASGWYELEGGKTGRVEDGTVLALLPGRAHRYGPDPGTAWEEHYVVAEGAWLDAWRARGRFEREVWRCGPPGLWRRRLQGFVERCVRRPAHPLVIASSWMALLAELVTEAADPAQQRWLARACEALDCERLSGAAPVPAVAARLGEGYDAFRKRFLRLSGESPARYRNRRLLDRVAEALVEEATPLATLAERFGFADAFHLSRRFKQTFGRSPSAFRQAAGIDA